MGSNRKGLFVPIVAGLIFIAAVVIGWVLIVQITGETPFIWVGTVPLLALHAGIVTFWCLYALVVWWIAERAISSETRDSGGETVYRLLLVCSSFFAFILGFVAAQEWNNVNTVRRDVSSGAAAIDTATYKAEALPKAERNQVTSALADLSRSISCQDIPSIEATGSGSQQTVDALRSAFRAVTDLPPGIQQKAIFVDLLDEVGSVSAARRQILAGANTGLPGVILVAIFAIAAILLALFIAQSARNRRAHTATIIGLVVLISIGTSMVVSLARPFGGAATMEEEFDQASRASFTDCSKLSEQ